MQQKTLMEYRNLGPSTMKVSVISYGNWLNSNDPETKERNKQIMKHAWDLGINFFDTAEVYGFGEAEVQMGEALNELMKEKGVQREDLVISTKIFFGAIDSSKRRPNEAYLSRKHIVEGLRNSLKRLNLNYVDIVFAHRYDDATPLEETCRAFDWCVRKGLTNYWGTSEWTSQQIIEAYGICDRLGLYRPIAEQPQYNMLVRDKFEWEYERVFGTHKMGSTVWSPLASGQLTGKYNDSLKVEGSRFMTFAESPVIHNILKQYYGTPEALESTQSKFRKLGELAKELGCNQAQLAMAWVIKNKDVSTAITSATRKEQLDDIVQAISVVNNLTKEVEERIEQILQNKPKTRLDISTLGEARTRRDYYI